MTDTTPQHALPYIAAAQSQKHLTHNEGLRIIDAVLQLAVRDRDAASAPAAPSEGDRYLVPPTGATGAWAAHGNAVAIWQDGAWTFLSPREGWLAWVADEDKVYAYTGASWTPLTTSVNPAALVGVNATADATNRLTVKSNAILFSHDDVTPGTGDLRLVLNKSAAAGTNSLLFQTGYSGRAEFGTAGSDDFSLKVSADGSTWRTAFSADKTTGFFGIGMARGLAPSAPLHVIGSVNDALIGSTSVRFDRYDPAGGNAAAFIMRKATISTSVASPSAVQSGDGIGAFVWRGYGPSGFLGGGVTLVGQAAETFTATAAGQDLLISTNPIGSVASVERVRIEANGATRPGADNAYTLGSSAFRWASVWAANGTIQTSDQRDKDVISPLATELAAVTVDAINPVIFRWKIGGQEMVPSDHETETDVEGAIVPKMVPKPIPGRRLHAGFLAQDVKGALDAAGLDFGVWGLEDAHDASSRQWLRPDQLIPLLWSALKQTRTELADLKSRIASA